MTVDTHFRFKLAGVKGKISATMVPIRRFLADMWVSSTGNITGRVKPDGREVEVDKNTSEKIAVWQSNMVRENPQS